MAIDGFDVDVPDTAAELGWAGSGDNRSAYPKARVVALSECGTHAFLAAEVGGWASGEKTLAMPLHAGLRRGELLTADRNFYSWQVWDRAAATGADLLWRAPTGLTLPMVAVLADGTYVTVLVKPSIRGSRRDRILAAARAERLDDCDDAVDDRGLPVAHLAWVVEHDVPDRDGNGTGELIVLLTTVCDSGAAHADELAEAYHFRWEHETGNDQLKTHPRGPGITGIAELGYRIIKRDNRGPYQQIIKR